MIAPELPGFYKHHEVKVAGFFLIAVEVIARMADVDYPTVWRLDFKLVGERQERRYVAAGSSARQNYGWCRLFH